MIIREANKKDWESIWPFFKEIVKEGSTYTYSPDINKEEAFQIWMKTPEKTFVAVIDNNVVGTYYIKKNQPGLGSHICNAGFMVDPKNQGKGIGEKLGAHSFLQAKNMGFKAMQFNFVVSTNKKAISLWKKMGFEIVGTIPDGFNSLEHGYTDILIMYRKLD